MNSNEFNKVGLYLGAAMTLSNSFNYPTRPVKSAKTPKTKTIRNRRAKNKHARVARKRGRK